MSDKTKIHNPSLIGIITKPLLQFDRICKTPLIGFPIVITMIFLAAGTLMIDKTSIIDTKGLAIIIGVIIGVILGIFTLSALYMFFTTFASSTVTLKQLGSMNTYISFIFAIDVLIRGIVIFIIDENPAIGFTDLAMVIHLPFVIWIIVLTALGLEKVAGFPRKLAWPVAIVIILASFFGQLGILILILVLFSLVKFGLDFTKPKDN